MNSLQSLNEPDPATFESLKQVILVAGAAGSLLLLFIAGFTISFVFLVCMASLWYAADMTRQGLLGCCQALADSPLV